MHGGRFQLIVDKPLFHYNAFTTAFLDPVSGCIPQTSEGAKVIAAYMAFFVAQIVLAAIVPGKMMDGLPTKDGKRLPYLCNGYLCYYICLWGLFVVDYVNPFTMKGLNPMTMTFGWGHGVFPLTHIHDHFGQYLFVSTVIGDLTSVAWYVYGILTPQPEASSGSGNVVYDFFMGSVLYPRFGIVDIKMIAECRWSWLTLFMLTLSCAVAQMGPVGQRDVSNISPSMWMMLLAHWLYSNATVKGEHYIPGTWDMFHEKFGWMLNFWNITGVPFLYCFQSFYIERNQAAITAFAENFNLPWTLPSPVPAYFSHVNVYYISIFTILIVGYYIFDSANCQKASCKLPDINRNLFPSVPWAILKNPYFIKTPKGNLLCDGWYRYARKMQYTGDILMALSWALACGFVGSVYDSMLPYFYVVFFTCMITHRQWRDEIRCREKYGKHWEEYTSIVPNVFVPDFAFFEFLFFGKEKDLKPKKM